ncbi:MAG: 4Fe-4S binding protein [Lachnospiraceae bacterium]|nr:4Fe-4S binding protein [Lachnospiraceae bacterium]
MAMKKSYVDKTICVACGVCTKVCPKQAIIIIKGCYAKVDAEHCVGCRKCEKNCPAGCIEVREG